MVVIVTVGAIILEQIDTQDAPWREIQLMLIVIYGGILMNFMIRDIDEETWDKFKIICIMEKPKLTLNEKVKSLIEEEVKVKTVKFTKGRRE